jgi:dTDP-4-dehydrorhamnose reductase
VGKELLGRGFLPLECDITKPDQVDRVINKIKPDLLIHLAGNSDVEYCQKLGNEKEVVLTNVRGTSNVFKSLHKLKLPGVFLSTDQVWRGGYFEKHKEDSKLTPAVNFYAMTKVAAESIVQSFDMNIIRTSYLFNWERLGAVSTNQPVFIRRSFLHLQDFCDLLENYCNHFYKMPKILHLAGVQTVSWYRFVSDIFPRSNIKPRFIEKEGFAPRPWFGGLDVRLSLQLGFPKRNYLDGVERMKYES